jgi:serine/threonine-protein kinase RsbW
VESKCQFSTLTIPNDPAYANAAARYVVEIASIIGFDEQDLDSISDSVSRAIVSQMEYSFEPGENASIEISCERVLQGLKISLKDRGLPFDDTLDLDQKADITSSFGLEIFHLKENMQEVLLNNLGPEGKEIVLIKDLKNKTITDYYAACDLEPYDKPEFKIAPVQKQRQCTVRQMKPQEAAEVSKSIYKTYGYTYPHDFVYYPKKIIALNESGQLDSAVAVIEGNEIAGHCAFHNWDENPQLGEMVAGVIKPEFRAQGCFAKMTEYLASHAQSKGCLGVFGQAVTNHVYSQRSGHRSGMHDCAILLGQIPKTADFKGLNGISSQKISMVMGFRYLQQPGIIELYPPLHHETIIRKIYAEMGVTPKIKWQKDDKLAVKNAESVFRINVIGPFKFARIIIDRYGGNIVTALKTKLKELCLKNIEVITLYLNLADPLTSHFCDQFEQLGFFFAGVLPMGLQRGDALILQYLNNVPIDYAHIQLESDLAKLVLSHIQEHDPNQV